MIKTKYVASAMLMAITLSGCKEVPKATRGDSTCTTSVTTSTTATTVSKTTQTTTTMSTTTETTTAPEEVFITEEETTVEIVQTEAESNPMIEVYEVEAEPITTGVSSAEYLGEWQAVWYCATDMGYSYSPYGASGNQLISGYSVACDNLPFGTRLLIECDYFTKEVRVDDCGVGIGNTLDLYYFDRSEIPDGLRQAGRMPISVSIIN